MKREKCIQTKKRRYPSQREAEEHLKDIRKLPVRPEIIPTRCYECEFCDGWHLASKQIGYGVHLEHSEEFKKYLKPKEEHGTNKRHRPGDRKEVQLPGMFNKRRDRRKNNRTPPDIFG